MDIFRKSALDKLASPDQLDKLIKITSPQSWLALVFFLLIIMSTVVWSLVGSIPDKIQAQGIIISSGETRAVVSTVEGEMSDITVEKNDYVLPGETIARISQKPWVDEAGKVGEQIRKIESAVLAGQPGETQISESTLNLVDIKNQIADIEKQIEKAKGNDPLPKLAADLGRSRNETAMYQSDLEKRDRDLESARTALEKNKVLFDLGAIAQVEYQKLLEARDAADYARKNTQFSLSQSQDNQASLQKQYLKAQEDFSQEVAYMVFRRKALEANFGATKKSKLDSLRLRMAEIRQKLGESEIVSTVEGLVVSVGVKKGNVIQRGTEIARIMEKGNRVNESNAVFYVPLEKGKKLVPGSRMNVYPSTANRQEYGHMVAAISNVSKFVASAEEMRAKLGNEELVNTFLKAGVLVQVDAYLLKDSSSASGYYWANKKGKTLTVREGTLCTASILIGANRPITFILPLLKEKLTPFEE
jgi:HlyD family secretion protein